MQCKGTWSNVKQRKIKQNESKKTQFSITKNKKHHLVGVEPVSFFIRMALVYKNIEQSDSSENIPTQIKIAGGLSLFLWAGVMLGGRWIGHIIWVLEIRLRTNNLKGGTAWTNNLSTFYWYPECPYR